MVSHSRRAAMSRSRGTSNSSPDLTLRDQLSYQCHAWAGQANPVVQATACDIYGNCATASKTVDTSNVAQAADDTAAPVLVWPPAGSTIAIGAAVQLQMAAALQHAAR